MPRAVVPFPLRSTTSLLAGFAPAASSAGAQRADAPAAPAPACDLSGASRTVLVLDSLDLTGVSTLPELPLSGGYFVQPLRATPAIRLTTSF